MEWLGMSDQIALRTCCEQHTGSRSIDSGPRGFDAVDSQRQFIKRFRWIASTVFFGQTGGTGVDAAPYICSDDLRFEGIPGFEIGVHGQINRPRDLRDVL